MTRLRRHRRGAHTRVWGRTLARVAPTAPTASAPIAVPVCSAASLSRVHTYASFTLGALPLPYLAQAIAAAVLPPPPPTTSAPGPRVAGAGVASPAAPGGTGAVRKRPRDGDYDGVAGGGRAGGDDYISRGGGDGRGDNAGGGGDRGHAAAAASEHVVVVPTLDARGVPIRSLQPGAEAVLGERAGCSSVPRL